MYSAANEVEATLLTSIADDASCDVYADWLEERGDDDRAEFLRIHKKLRRSTWKSPWLVDRFTILSRCVDPAWRERVVPVPRVPDIPTPKPAAVQLPPVVAPQPKMRREVVVPPVGWMPPRVPTWIRVSSTCAYAFIVVAFVLYWLT